MCEKKSVGIRLMRNVKSGEGLQPDGEKSQ